MLVFLDIPDNSTAAFNVCDVRPLHDLVEQVSARMGSNIATDLFRITGRHGISVEETLKASSTPWLALRGRLLGGKGGFGSTLRSQGNRMSANKSNNYDDCRDLYGRRLRTLKEAKGIMDKLDMEEKAKEEAAENRRKKIADGLKERPARKYRFDDTPYMRKCEEIVEETKKTTRKAIKERMRKQNARSGSPQSSSKTRVTIEKPTMSPLIPLFDGDLGSSSSSSEDEGGNGNNVSG
ncbi:hypothetical protein COEREDRAFT_10862 [Coemansia reversa NRRL 1564]|uniref:SDE2-like domain-containing protein n=1 Tax=Coemansia reversa (strain ATCC 12441 / NRRL 1564) TaxID=763665 RepID=A0A2G5B4J8_COERN|nr:hypothetical protein COEREDRAFT_10862 [Coemansia reversa NRRL 1564]|eukprot:PIA13922.1 hypothetical protein COEREDRAFT_10862 [Coemansia reversa NRRL 1564]